MSKRVSWVQEVTESENSNFSKDTNKRFFDRKLFFYVTLGIMFLIEAIVAICFCASIDKPVYMVGPLILMILDLLFLIVSKFINFRQKYALPWLIVYLALSVVMTVVTLVLAFVYNGMLVMSISSAVIISVIQIAKVVLILLAVKIAKTGWQDNKKYTLNGIICSAVVGLLFIAFLAFNYSYGFMGQGGSIANTQATLSYRDNGSGQYVVNGTLGDGNEVIIPETFNGKTVVGVDAEIFQETKIDSMIIKCEDFRIFNIDEITAVNNKIKIQINKKSINQVRSSLFYSMSQTNSTQTNEAIDSLFKSIIPYGLEVNETFYNYNYIGSRPHNTAYVPTVIINKNTHYDIWEAYSDFDGYFTKTDRHSSAHLQWCYNNNDGYMLDESNIKVEGNQVYMPFSKVYYLNSLDGNDSKWHTSIASQYIAYNELREYYDSLPMRSGFSVEWFAGSQSISGFDVLTEYLQDKQGQKINIQPLWTVNKPVIQLSPIDKTITYGENTDVVLRVQSDVKYVSSLYYNNNLVTAVIDNQLYSSNGTPVYSTMFELNGYKPTDSGKYEIRIVAKDESITALTSETVYTDFDFVINKKGLNFTWTLPDGEIYDKTDKLVDCSYDPADVIGNDTIVFEKSLQSVCDAGSYVVGVILGTECDTLYTVATGRTANFSILPKAVILDWDYLDEATLVYDGLSKTAGARVTNLIYTDLCDVFVEIISANKKDVGDVTYQARSLSNSNYTLQGASETIRTYTITPLELSFDWILPTNLIYSATAKVPNVRYNNVVSGDYCILATRNTDNINVGEVVYTAVGLTGKESGNYVLPEEGLTTSFTIEQRKVTLDWNVSSTLEYDGNEKEVNASVKNICPDDVCSVSVRRISDNASEVGDISYEAYEISNSNYVLVSESGLYQTYTITPRTITYAYEVDGNWTYDGTEQVMRFEIRRIVDGDDCELVLEHTPNINAGLVTYEVTGLTGADSHNYELSSSSDHVYTFEIKQREVELIWTLPENLLYDRTEKIATVRLGNIIAGDECRTIITRSGDNVKAGQVTYSVSQLSGAQSGNYCLPSVNYIYFTIAKVVAQLSWTLPQNAVYDGSAKPAYATIDNLVAGDDCTLVLSYSNRVNDGVASTTINNNNTDAGSVTYRATGFEGEDAENYDTTALLANPSRTQTYQIAKADRDFSVTMAGWIYGQNANQAQVTHNIGDSANVSYSYAHKGSTAYDVTAPKNAGEYTLRAVVATSRNYKSAVETCEFTIVPKEATLVWTYASDETSVYNGRVKSVIARVSNLVSGDVCTVGVEITSDNRVNVGDVVYKAISLDNSNYKLPEACTANFPITHRTATFVWNLNGSNVYDGNEKSVTATVGNIVSGDVCNVTVAITSQNRVNAGNVTYTATALSNSNYKIEASQSTTSQTYTIAKRTANLEWHFSGSDVYDGREKNVTATVSNLVDGDRCNVSVNITSSNRVNAGEVTYTAIAITNANYALSLSISDRSYTLEIKKAQRTGISLTINGWQEGGSANAPRLSGYSGEATFTYASAGSSAFMQDVPTAAGQYVVKATIAESENYLEFEVTATFTIEEIEQGE